jgi:alpha-ketoglutarate-dependent taurine dioxygenase
MTTDAPKPSRTLPTRGRNATSAAPGRVVKTELLAPDQQLPLVIKPAIDGVDLVAWAATEREMLQEKMLEHGAILFRGFNINSTDRFEAFIAAVSGGTLEYKERSSPRSQVSGNIYTSTDYPPDQSIFLHNENSYQHTWPLKLFFCCIIAAEEGGETPLADTRKIYDRLDPELRDKFIDKKVMYVRNFSDRFGLPWSTVFQTTDKEAVEAYCEKVGLKPEWKPNGGLRTRAIRQAVAKHPITGKRSWFNHATFFNVSTLPPAIRDAMQAEFEDEDLPNNSYYGDGSEIEPETLDALREAYDAETISFPWEKGDVVMIDNMSVAHARSPFKGARKVVVGMADPISANDLPPLE